jgi:hypothetical protein
MSSRYIGSLVLAFAALIIGSLVSFANHPMANLEAASKGRVSNDCVPLSASGNNVYVSWVSNKTGNWDVMFRVSNDNGKSFGEKINLSNTPNSTSLDPHIAAYGDNVYVSWHDNKTGNWDTYVKTSKDRGQTFGDIIQIKGTGTMPQTTKIGVQPGLDPLEDSPLEATHVAASGNNVYITSWDKKTGNWEVFLSRSNDNGETFGDSINLSNTTDKRSDASHIYALDNNVYLTWWETSKNGTTVPVFRASNDNGESFGPVLTLPANGTIGGE